MKNKLVPLLILLCVSFLATEKKIFANEYSEEYELIQNGQRALLQEDFFSAIDLFRTAIRLNPSSVKARLGIAETLYLLGEYTEASKEISQAIKLAPHNRSCILLKARIFTAQGRHKEAISLYQNILSNRPHDAQANRGLGEIYAIQGQVELAYDAYQKSLDYSPQDMRVLLQLVILHDKFGERALAEKRLKEALSFHPNNVYVRVQAAEHYALYGEWAESSEQLNWVFSLLNGVQDTWYQRVIKLKSILSLRRGDPAVALQSIEKIYDKSNLSLLFLQARAYRELGKENEAQNILSFILDRTPDDEIVRIFREMPLVQSIGNFEEYRSSVATWHVEKAKRLEKDFYFDQALIEYRRARRIDSLNPNIWMAYANQIRLKGFPRKYQDELAALVQELGDTPNVKKKVQERLELLEHSENMDMMKDWNIKDPWNITPASWTMAVFLIPSDQSFPSHEGAGTALASYFADLIDSQSILTVLDLDGGFFPKAKEISSFREALRLARDTVDYFSILEFTDTGRNFLASSTLYLAQTGEILASSTQGRNGQEKISDSINFLMRDIVSTIPEKMSIIAIDGDRVLLDKGRWHGIKKTNQSMVVLRTGGGRPSLSDEGLTYSQSNYLGTVEIVKIFESLSEGLFLKSGDFDFLSIGDEVFSIPIPEITEHQYMPNPAFRSKLLAVP